MYSYDDFRELSGQHLKFTRIKNGDVKEIIPALLSPTTWASVQRGVNTPEKLQKYLEGFVTKQDRKELLTLVGRIIGTNEVAAISTYHCAPENFTRLEIGFTWIADKWMRTFVNTEMKFLMLTYAFEKIGVKRVEFSVDPRNEKSNTAMKRIGGHLDGMLRRWRFLDESDPGDRNIYSIIDTEWPEKKAHLQKLTAAYQR